MDHLSWAVICTDLSVCDVFSTVRRYLVGGNEHYCVGTLYCAGDALCKTAEFFTEGILPCGAIFGVFDEMSVFHEFAGVCVEDAASMSLGYCRIAACCAERKFVV